MKKTVYIRVDGSSLIGLGHLVRCVSLASMLKNDFNIIFVCIEIPENILNEIIKKGFELMKIISENDFLSILQKNQIVILDHYILDSNYQKMIKKIGCKLVCIDDIHEKVFHADLIINHAPGVKSTDYEAQNYTKYALGLDYALLRPVFLENAKNKNTKFSIKTGFVCFGGSDPKNLTQKALEELLKFDQIEKINVVAGSANLNINKLKEFCDNHSKISLYYALNENKMLELMNQSDLAIVPSSGILIETLATDCVIISGYYIDNQKEIYNGFKGINAFYDAEDFSKMDQAIEKALNSSTNNKLTFIDGKSGERFKTVFKQL